MTDRSAQVREEFADAARYLGRHHTIRLRADAIRQLAEGAPRAILDVGCGDGSLSLPLLGAGGRLVLVDTSHAMLDRAKENAGPGLRDRITLVCDDFMAVEFEPASFDLVLCIGVLAHVGSPRAVLARIGRLVKPGGTVIVQHTDAAHPIGFALVLYSRVRSALRPGRYPWNALTGRQVLRECASLGLTPTGFYTYGVPHGLDRLLGPDRVYRLSRWLFGDVSSNRNRWAAFERMHRLRRRA